MLEVEGGTYKASKITFKDLATKWLDEELSEKTKKSQQKYNHIVKNILIPYFKNKRVVQILDNSNGDSEIKKFLKLHSQKPHTTFNYYRDLLKWILGWNRPGFEMPKVKCKKTRWRQVNFLTKDEMGKLVSLMSLKFQPIGWILAETGIDVSEALNLKWDDF
jgi:integrase